MPQTEPVCFSLTPTTECVNNFETPGCGEFSVERCASPGACSVGFGAGGVHDRGRHVTDPGVSMGVVVPSEEVLAERTGVLEGLKAGRKVGLVFQGLELRFGVWVVIADMGPAVAFGDTEICEQQRHGLGAHRGTAVGMQGELPAGDALSQVAAMSWWASSADSRGAIIQPTTERLNTSRMT